MKYFVHLIILRFTRNKNYIEKSNALILLQIIFKIRQAVSVSCRDRRLHSKCFNAMPDDNEQIIMEKHGNQSL